MDKKRAQTTFERILTNGDAFSREDEADDAIFYGRDRFVSHLDGVALKTIEDLIQTLVVETEPAILDLMASWDSHIPFGVKAKEVIGLGLNRNELTKNKTLTDHVVHDLNKEPKLPFEDARFDVVLNTVSVDYLTRPFDVFREVGRILKPGGLFLVTFSNRMFPSKAVKIWRQSGGQEKIMLVEDFFKASGLYEKPKVFVSKGKPRSEHDKYANKGIPSDPVYAVYADRIGGDGRSRPTPVFSDVKAHADRKEEIERRRLRVRETLECPHCGVRMKKWLVPDSPFSTWDTEFMYICFNDQCPYLVRGWDVMNKQGNWGVSYRQMFNPENGCLMPVPVPSLKALRESIVEEDAC